MKARKNQKIIRERTAETEGKTVAWTQKELEELYSKVNEKGSTDAEYRERLLRDPVSAIEEIAGRPLPESYRLECIASDNSYSATYVIPDFAQGEIDFNELRTVAGGSRAESQSDIESPGSNEEEPAGLSVALIVSVCAAAGNIGPCPANACAANIGCAANACGGNACAADGTCIGDACGAEACAAQGGCGANACAAEACALDVGCAWNACAADACAANIGCLKLACHSDICSGHGGCASYGHCFADGACSFDISPRCVVYSVKTATQASDAPAGYDPFGQSIAGAAAGQYFGKSQGDVLSTPSAPAAEPELDE